MSSPFSFHLLSTDGPARRGRLLTAHGPVETPAFMPVGTQGSVKAIDPDDLHSVGAEIILGNTYHLMMRPGADLVEKAGGLQRFSGWNGPVLTDSGGFQVYSLKGRTKIKEEGVRFQSHWDGAYHFLTPEGAVEVQLQLGSDIIMVLDECLAYPCGEADAEASTARTHRWAERSLQVERKGGKALFSISQGGMFPAMRRASSQILAALPFEGHAIGGLSVGEPKGMMEEMLNASLEPLPPGKPRYLMGVGTPEDLWHGVSQGVDMFDCVMPTRNARNGTLFTSQGKISIKNGAHRESSEPLDPECGCLACRRFSRAYLRHLYLSGELLSHRLLTVHNLAFYLHLMASMRAAIAEGRFLSAWKAFRESYERTSG